MTDSSSHSFKSNVEVPEPTLGRLPWYLSAVKLLRDQGVEYVSSTQIARQANMDASQIAKDLSYLSITGRTRVGYQAEVLISALEDFLEFTTLHEAVLFGVGNLGAALLQDKGVQQFGLRIVAAFDIRPDLVGTTYGGIPIFHIDEAAEVLKRFPVSIGVLTVPITSAQEVADRMVGVGLRAIWNFTPLRIRAPWDIVVQNTSLYSHLALMYNRLSRHSL